MKKWLITLPLICAAGFALAEDMQKDAATERHEAVATPRTPAAHYRMAKHKVRLLPSGDLRQCLDRKTRAAIIRCSETKQKR